MKKFLKLLSLFLLFIIVINTVFPCIANAENIIAETYNNLPESQLGLTNILNIILISVGIVLILLGIAIFIRLKNI